MTQSTRLRGFQAQVQLKCVALAPCTSVHQDVDRHRDERQDGFHSIVVEMSAPAWVDKPFPRLPQAVETSGASWLERRTIPIHKMTLGGKPIPHGTGVLFEIGDTVFILTAAHVLDVTSNELLLVCPSKSGDYVKLNGDGSFCFQRKRTC